MSDVAMRYRRVAAGFTSVAQAVPPGAWDAPAPCEGWVARDVVRHMVEWIPGFFGAALDVPAMPPVDDDPAGAWDVLNRALQAALDDAATATREIDTAAGRHAVQDAIGTFCLGDVLVHTWDLARAAGLDETLDAEEVHTMYVGMEPMDEALRASGHFGPRVPVSDDADEQTKLIAFTGRTP